MLNAAPTRPPVWILFGITIAGILANTLLTPNIPDILKDLGQPESRAGILVASGPLPGIIMAPIIGVLADRHGRRRVLLPCLVVFALGGLAVALSPTFSVLLASRVLQGIGGAGLINLAVVLIGDHWEGLERTKLIGRNSAVLTACLAILPAISGLIAEVTSWRVSVGLATLALPIAVLAWRTLPDTRPEHARTLADQLHGAAQVVRQPQVLTTLLGGFMLFFVIFGLFLTALPVHLEEQFGLGPGARGLILSVPAIGSTIAAFNLSRIRERFGASQILTASMLLIAAAALGVGLAPAVLLVVVASIIYGLGDGAAIPTLQDVTASAAPTEQRASVMAAWVATVRLGQTLGPLVAAAVFGAWSTSVAMVLGAVVFALTGLLFTIQPVEAEAPPRIVRD